MSFLYAGALAIAVLVLGPLIAHLLRRRRTDEKPFAPARLVPPSPPIARQRHRVDDRALYAVRTLQVLLLALLGAAPFVRCSGLSLGRRAGASIALAVVLDDSMSMQAQEGGKTRWDRAYRAARDLVEGAREGDSVALVLAGAPARIALAPTTDLTAARSILSGLRPTDRATDLDGAVELARTLVRSAPQPDRRVVLLSDLSDGQSAASEQGPGSRPPLGEGGDVPLWVPLEDIATDTNDCGVIRADRRAGRVAVHVACSSREAAAGRKLQLRVGTRVLGEVALPAETSADVSLDIEEPSRGAPAASSSPQAAASAPGAAGAGAGAPAQAPAGAAASAPSGAAAAAPESTEPAKTEPPRVVLTGEDAIAADDEAPVLTSSAAIAVAVISDAATAHVVTGGPPPVEQALAALAPDLQVRPLPAVPDQAEDLAPFAALIIDDPPGFTPEARRSISAFLERGGVALVFLGPRAALAPLGAGFEPLFTGSVAWSPSPVPGIADRYVGARLGPAAAGLDDLHPEGRATLPPTALAPGSEIVARWKDGAPWLFERRVGRGLSMVLTLPASPDRSDLPLRPAFLALLDDAIDAARIRSGANRTDVGQAWAFEGARNVAITGPDGKPRSPAQQLGRPTYAPDQVGLYTLDIDGDRSVRIVAPVERELALHPRPVAASARSSAFGDVRARVDLSRYLALGLLALFVTELALRLVARSGGAAGALRARSASTSHPPAAPRTPPAGPGAPTSGSPPSSPMPSRPPRTEQPAARVLQTTSASPSARR